MDKPLLNDPDVFPSPEALSKTLGRSYAILEELIATITGEEIGLTVEWRFYKDGKLAFLKQQRLRNHWKMLE